MHLPTRSTGKKGEGLGGGGGGGGGGGRDKKYM